MKCMIEKGEGGRGGYSRTMIEKEEKREGYSRTMINKEGNEGGTGIVES